jgi:type VI secretion system protein ImpF
MARPSLNLNLNLNAGLMPSLIDRLIDPESMGTAARRGYDARQIMECVRRDLEDLFNTHQSDVGIPVGHTEVLNSVVAFGLPDLPSVLARTGGRPDEIRVLIAETIQRFEPRLRDIRVFVATPSLKEARQVRFRIEAVLDLDPSPDVVFETVVEMSTGQTSIRSTEG